MSKDVKKTLPGRTRRAEELHLKETLAIIRDNVDRYRREVAEMREDIDRMQDHFHDDNPELINTLENTYTMYSFLSRTLERNERALKKPYFGRIDFYDETHGTSEAFYIGRSGISKDATHPAVIDWRAPVANVYYENGLGPCTYLSPEGDPLPIDLKAKRTYEIADGKLLNFFDTEVIANDDLLISYLSQNKQAVLGEIVATIQKEQNEIIRCSPYHNCLVQGVAGSGKTTVAMHRIAYILYNYPNRFRPEDFYIVGSNKILLNYITGVLPDLDVYGIRQMTMEQLFVRLLYEDWDDSAYKIKEHAGSGTGTADAVKGTLSWFHDLEAFCSRLEWSTIPTESVYLNRNRFVEGIVDGKPGVYDRTQEISSDEGPILLMDTESICRYIRTASPASIQSKIDMLNERLQSNISDEFLGKDVTYTEAECKAILKAYKGTFGSRTWKTSIYSLYRDFLKEQAARGFEIEMPKNAFDVYDLAALAYLYKRVKETDVISEAHHVVIDEAQDFGMMAYSALKYCIKDCTYTIMGDVSQNIHFNHGLNDWEELKQLYLTDELAGFGVLKKSYRNTVEISNFATNILRHGSFSIYPVEPIIRHGEQPEVTALESRGALLEAAASKCRDWQDKGLNTIAVICRDEASAARTTEELGRLVTLMENPLETAEFGNGIMVLPVNYTKGLEFDAVLILDPSENDYPADDGHAKLLYVAATRALHELCILHTGSPTGLLTAGSDLRLFDSTPSSSLTKKRAFSKKMTSGTDTALLLAEKKFQQPASAAPKSVSGSLRRNGPAPSEITFGSMPSNEAMRTMGHAAADQAVRWISKQADGMYLTSAYGVLRISPIAEHIVRITFSKGTDLSVPVHPKIAMDKPLKKWLYRNSAKVLEIKTAGLYLQVDKRTGTIYYMNGDKRPLLAERNRECRLIETPSLGQPRARLFLDWPKQEPLFALGSGIRATLPLKGVSRYISHSRKVDKLPMVLSERGYGIVIASDGPVFCCNLPTHGTHICAENTDVLDYYLIAGSDFEDLIREYGKLCK